MSIQLDAEIPLDTAGQRLDRVLAILFPQHSRSRLAGWVRQGVVQLDGIQAVVPRQAVTGGEVVRIAVEDGDATPQIVAEPIALDIRYQDADLLVLNKPAGLVVHPGAGNPRGTLQNALLYFDSRLAGIPRAGIVHRLDKDTSGLLVVARSLTAHTALVAMLSRHIVQRRYQAVVRGRLIAGGTVDAPIGRHPSDRLRQSVRDSGGRQALTRYRVIERFRGHTLVQCELETGRTHQIRVHMAYLGNPLVGDPIYGGGLRLPSGAILELLEVLRGFRRQALHAASLRFPHPLQQGEVYVEVPVPEDFTQLLAVLRLDRDRAEQTL